MPPPALQATGPRCARTSRSSSRGTSLFERAIIQGRAIIYGGATLAASTGVVAAGHPLSAEAGAGVLREGGNAVDAAICAVLASFATESTLTGFGAGGFFLVHDPRRDAAPPGSEQPPRDVLVDFFVAAPGLGGAERRSELVEVPVHFGGGAVQIFNAGAASCGVPGSAAGLEHVARRYGTMPLSDLVAPAIELARHGAKINRAQGFLFEILEQILTLTPDAAAVYAPAGAILHTGDRFTFPALADALELFGAEGAEPFYRGRVAEAVCRAVGELGGTLDLEDMAAYEPIERAPVSAGFRGAHVMTNPPPSSGGVLIAYALAVLERLGDRAGVLEIVAATEAANALRGERFDAGLHERGYVERLVDPAGPAAAAARIAAGEWIGGAARAAGPPGAPDRGGRAGESATGRLGSTTHISVIDGDGICASVTCSSGSGSGILVAGTGVHLNNMLGEQDLNPSGFHLHPPGQRVSSMMAPTVVLKDGHVLMGIGSAGSNRIRSAIIQTAVGVLEQGLGAEEAVRAGRIHFEDGTVQAEPGVSEDGLAALEASGVPVVRWREQNLFFGGAQAVIRDPRTGHLSGAGDPRRGGHAVVV